MKGVLKHSDQEEQCSNCGETVMADTILDRETGRYYFFCPACEAPNVEK